MPRNTSPRHLLCAALLAVLAAAPTQAENKPHSPIQPGSCPIEPAEARALPASAFTDDEAKDGLVHIAGDEAETQLGEKLTFRGNVEILRNELRLFADEIIYDQRRNNLKASGQLLFQRQKGETLRAPFLNYDFDTDHVNGEQGQFSILEPKMRGEAGRFFLDSRNVFRFDSVRFTTCPQGQDDWFLRASQLTLDKNTETGTARHTVFEFSLFGLPPVPVFYTPYLSFPLTNERRSGFLNPHIGNSSKAGFFIGLPYYLNLAPNYDLTISPRYMSKHGLQWGSDFRYMGHQTTGRLIYEYLPNDKVTGEDRQKFIFQHEQRLSSYWSTQADLEWVSDNDYFNDLGSTSGLSALSRTHLPRMVRFDYGGEYWRFLTRFSTFQTIDPNIGLNDQPYQRLPQIVLSADLPGGSNRPHLNLYSEWVHFYRAGQTGVNPPAIPPPDWIYSPYGQRTDIYPSVSLPLRTTYFYFTPKVGYRYTAWNLRHFEKGQSIGTSIIALPDANPERGLPIYSLDSGLVLERPSLWGQTRLTQTLEPRLFYVDIPYRDQDNLPIFDTAVPDFSFYNFFRENRFVGADRVGDTRQVTAAVTSRFLGENTGIEHVRFSLGQVKYFEDRRVSWPAPVAGAVAPATSDLIGEVAARLGEPWFVRSAIQWDDKNNETRKANFYVTYRPAGDRTVNLGFRMLETPPTTLDRQFDLSAQWPLSPQWAGLARWNYSLRDDRSILALAGLEYSHCCWGFRLTARHRIRSDGVYDNTVMFHMLLGGISTSYDQNPDSPMRINRFMFDQTGNGP